MMIKLLDKITLDAREVRAGFADTMMELAETTRLSISPPT